jgi:hypothetical protein
MNDEITQELRDEEEVDIEPFEDDPDFLDAPWNQIHEHEGAQDDFEEVPNA